MKRLPLATREDELRRLGWTRMFAVEAFRVQEYIELYERTGMEVLVERAAVPDTHQQCSACCDGLDESLVTVYTRPIDDSARQR